MLTLRRVTSRTLFLTGTTKFHRYHFDMELYTQPRDAWNRPAYFSAGDGGIEYSIGRDRHLVLNSLVYNLLFEEGGLLVPDIFFFICEPLIGHLVQSEWPLLGRAIGQGLVIPAFRSPQTEDFSSVLIDIRKDKVLGIEEWRFLKHNTTRFKVAERLDEFVTRGDRVRRIIWPDGMGTRYARLLQRIFENRLPDSATEENVIMWKAVEAWRHNCLTEAERLTAAKDGTGIRRAEIFNALGHQLGILDRGREFQKLGELLDGAASLRDQALVERVRFFTDVVNVTYQRSQATEFGSLHNTLGPLTPVALTLFQPSRIHASNLELPTVLSVDVRLPTALRLLRAPGDRVLGARTGDSGLAYFAARSAWMNNRIRATDGVLADRLTSAARAYAKELRTIAPGRSVHAVMSTWKATAAGAGLSAAAAAIPEVVDYLETTNAISPEYALLSGLLGAGLSSLLVYKPSMKWELQIRRGQPPEVNLPT
jgi:hypothetical protein